MSDMTLPIHKQATRLGVVLVLVSLAMAAFSAQPAEAQLSVYRVEGVVYGPSFKPLAGASVSLHTMAGAKAAGATTDASGKYSLPNLNSGNYNLSVSDACCAAVWIPIQIAGTDPVIQQNAVLGDNQGEGPLQLKGIVRDEKSGKALPNVRIEMWNHAQASDSMGTRPVYEENHRSTISGADGSYAFKVHPGMVSLGAALENYDRLHANFEMTASRALDLPMRPAAGAIATISGQVKGSDGKPIPNAWVSVFPEERCEGDVCTTSTSPAPPGGASGSGDVSFWYEPAASPYAGAQTDETGRYTVQTTPGPRTLQAGAERHLENRTSFTVADGEKKTVNLVLERMPDDTVRIHGKVVDGKTGKGIPHAQVHLENQRWGHWNSTFAKDDGGFEFYTKPGYTIVTASAEKHYWLPCAMPAKGGSGIAPGEYYPCDDGGQRTRDRDYFSRAIVVRDEASSHDLRFDLAPRPEPTAELKGYVVNQSGQTAIPNVPVQFFNEFTRDWGTATTGDDGSFRIKVHGGYYGVRASADHYFDGVVNVEVADGESRRVDVPLTPGEKRHGYGCCVAYAERASMGAADGATAAGGEPKSAPPQADDLASEEVAMASGGAQEAYKGEAGGLGPYKPLSGADDGKSRATSPGAGVAVLVSMLALAAVLRRRND